MSRITPRYARPRYTQPSPTPTPRARPRRADALRAPFLSREGRPESVITDKMIDDVERAVLLRQRARRAAADPRDQAIERARCLKYGPKVGQEERGAIEIPCPPVLIKKLWDALRK